MLLQFAVENFACFAEEALFSMVASADTEHPQHVVQSESGRKPRILRAAALYGANAHGKTKFVEALRFAQRLVVIGTKSGQPTGAKPFRLDKKKGKQPSRFDFLINHEGVEYSYGFAVDGERVHEEWLFARPNIREMKYFERITDDDGRVRVEFGSSLAGRTKKRHQFLDFVAQGTRPNQLFLTEAVDRNVEKLQPLLDWFRSVLTVVSATAGYQPLVMRVTKEEDFVEFVADFLRRAGTGIDGVSTEEESLDFEKHMPGASEGLQEKIEADIRSGGVVTLSTVPGKSWTFYANKKGKPVVGRLKTIHVGKDGSQVRFDFEEESSGTQRVMEILPILADVNAGERVYVIDELDRKLHPLLSRLFVSTFLQRCGEEMRGQLIFTTHDTHLMDLNLLRRDQIWFFEKDEYGASKLYAMNELKVRSDLKVDKGYLNGRFGGIPIIRDLGKLVEEPC